MDIKQNDSEVGITVDTTLVIGTEKWKITKIGKQQKFRQNTYVPCSVSLLNKLDQPTSVSRKLFWFPKMKTSFKSLEEFKEFNPLN